MVATEQGGRGAERLRGRSAFLDRQVEAAMARLLELGGVAAESGRRRVDGHELHFLKAGAGPLVLLLHGAGGGAANWYRLMRPLAEQYSVVAIDLPGFGLSDSIEPEAPLGQQVAGLVARLLEAEGMAPLAIAGTSFGGLTALRLAELRPPRSLVLIDAAGLWPEASAGLRLACLPYVQRLGVKQTRRGARWLLRHVLTARRLPPEHEAALAEYIFASAARANARLLARGYRLFGGVRGQREVVTADEFGRLADRTLILWGERDRFLPAPRARLDAALAAGARLRIIPGAGHSPTWEAPDDVLEAILEFVADGRRRQQA